MKKLFMLFALCAVLFSCTQKKWEYHVEEIEGTSSGNYTNEEACSNTFDSYRLDDLGAEGWELVSACPIIETVYPNFGQENFVNGIRTNTRTAKIRYVFKREIRGIR